MRWFLFLSTLVLLLSCSEKQSSDILPERKMSALIWDLSRVDQFVNIFVAKDTTKDLKKERFKLYQQVFSVHKISEDQFSSSFKYYAAHPDKMKLLFDSLSTRADRERKDSYLRKDSIKQP